MEFKITSFFYIIVDLAEMKQNSLRIIFFLLLTTTSLRWAYAQKTHEHEIPELTCSAFKSDSEAHSNRFECKNGADQVIFTGVITSPEVELSVKKANYSGQHPKFHLKDKDTYFCGHIWSNKLMVKFYDKPTQHCVFDKDFYGTLKADSSSAFANFYGNGTWLLHNLKNW